MKRNELQKISKEFLKDVLVMSLDELLNTYDQITIFDSMLITFKRLEIQRGVLYWCEEFDEVFRGDKYTSYTNSFNDGYSINLERVKSISPIELEALIMINNALICAIPASEFKQFEELDLEEFIKLSNPKI
jgi:hypothetical protein